MFLDSHACLFLQFSTFLFLPNFLLNSTRFFLVGRDKILFKFTHMRQDTPTELDLFAGRSRKSSNYRVYRSARTFECTLRMRGHRLALSRCVPYPRVWNRRWKYFPRERVLANVFPCRHMGAHMQPEPRSSTSPLVPFSPCVRRHEKELMPRSHATLLAASHLARSINLLEFPDPFAPFTRFSLVCNSVTLRSREF